MILVQAGLGLAGGSMVTSSVIPAVSAAAEQAISTLLYTASQVQGSRFAGKVS
jgi:hypothetical protein